MQYRAVQRCSLLLATALAVGCDASDASQIDVTGTVAYRGKAVPKGTLLLQPQVGKAIIGVIDDQGNYQISAPRGTYQIAVVSSAAIPDEVDPWKGNMKLPPPFVPQKYGRPETSGASITVTPDEATIDIALN